ncbi:MAG: NAD(P)/FAD-dependent oxidoreductase, partial [Acutalibacteraceae bacterium]
KDSIRADRIIIATGRGGANFVADFCREHGVKTLSNSIDIGVRVEMKDIIWREFSSKIYEPKILYRTKTFEDRTRMFCFNQGGLVSAENNNGIITANGHSYAEAEKKTENCNFAILSSMHFTEPFNQPTEFAENISRLANMIGNGGILVQRFGDLVRGRRTNEHRLSQNTVRPTLKATAGDISLVLPHRILTNIIETIYALDKVAPGTANDDTLLYGCESKYYSIRPVFMNKDFELIDNVYIIGDGSGICRGLSQSGAMGIYVADRITSRG